MLVVGSNATSFEPVTTTALRATLVTRADADGVGALEWRVRAVQPERIAPVHATTLVGEQPELPAAMELTYPDGSTLPGTVARWERFDPALLEEPGSFPVTGVVAGSLAPARAMVHVCSSIEDGAVAGPLGAAGVACLDGASVTGPVTVRRGAGLVAIGATIAGPTTAAGAGEVWLVDSALHGPLSAVGTTGQLVVSGAEIRGGAILVRNRTGEHPVVVSGSTVDGPLVCLGNRPAPTDDGVPNTVAGPTVGQC